MAGVYPRVGGETVHLPELPSTARSIPAWAGKPPTATPTTSADVGVYPRVGGETSWRAHALRSSAGLSPRVVATVPVSVTVYPRVGGETSVS